MFKFRYAAQCTPFSGMGFVVPFPCGIPCFSGGLFSSEEARWRISPLLFAFDTDPQKVVFVAADRAATPKPRAELVPAQVVMKAVCMSAATVANHAVGQFVRNLEAQDDVEADDAATEVAAADDAQLAAARERAMADVAAMLRALREGLAEQEATDRAAAGRADADEDEDEAGKPVADTEWELVHEMSVEALPIHVSC